MLSRSFSLRNLAHMACFMRTVHSVDLYEYQYTVTLLEKQNINLCSTSLFDIIALRPNLIIAISIKNDCTALWPDNMLLKKVWQIRAGPIRRRGESFGSAHSLNDSGLFYGKSHALLSGHAV